MKSQAKATWRRRGIGYLTHNNPHKLNGTNSNVQAQKAQLASRMLPLSHRHRLKVYFSLSSYSPRLTLQRKLVDKMTYVEFFKLPNTSCLRFSMSISGMWMTNSQLLPGQTSKAKSQSCFSFWLIHTWKSFTVSDLKLSREMISFYHPLCSKMSEIPVILSVILPV